MELGFWETIKGSNNAADFKAYLDSYPDGPFAVAARARLQQIEAKQPSRSRPAPTPPPAAPPPAAPQSAIRDCPQCPEIVLIHPGAFEMGSTEMFDFEAPVHQVSIRKAVLHRPARSHVRGVGRMSRRRRLQAKAG